MERLAALIQEHQEELITAWRERVSKLPSARDKPRMAIEDHIPNLLDELSNALVAEALESKNGVQINAWAASHGIQRSIEHFDVADLVTEYNYLREEVAQFGLRHGIELTPNIVDVFWVSGGGHCRPAAIAGLCPYETTAFL